MRVIEKRASANVAEPPVVGLIRAVRRAELGLAELAEPVRVKGHDVDTIELVDLPPDCRGRLVGHAIVRTVNGGIVHAVLVERHERDGFRCCAVYLDRDSSSFVSIEVPS